MSKNETNKVSTQLTWARENDIIPWAWIVDETRAPERISAWENPAEYVEVVKRAYRRDRWTDQPDWIEVWSEKGTIRGTLAPVLQDYGVTFRVMHGYGSATAIKQVADESFFARKTLTVLYVGDWDPSGLHMSEVDLPRRLDEYGGDVKLVRLARTVDDCYRRPDPLDDHDDDAFPWFSVATKRRDSRYQWYRERFGSQCWELDALSPVVLRHRVAAAIDGVLDHDAWARAEVVERAERDSLSSILADWPGISRQAQEYDEERP